MQVHVAQVLVDQPGLDALLDPDPGPGHAVHVVQMQVDLVSNLA